MTSVSSIVPLMDRLLVKRIIGPVFTKGGILLTDIAASKKSTEAVVVAVGPGYRNPETGKTTPLAFESGNRVLLPPQGGVKVPVEGDALYEYLLYRESEIIAKLE